MKIKNTFFLSILLAAFVLTSGTFAAAPWSNDTNPGFKDWVRSGSDVSLGLLDPSKLTIQHNASFGFTSGSGQSLMQSVYMTRFGYQLSNPVTLTFLLGFQNSRVSGTSYFPGSYNSVIGGMTLDYRPRNNILFRLEVLHSPLNYLNSGVNNRFWASPESNK